MAIIENHPILALPNQTDILLKYMDIPSFISLIQDRKVAFTRVDLFNDKYEGTLTKPMKKLVNSSIINELPSECNQVQDIGKMLFETSKHDAYINCWMNADHEMFHMWKIYAKETGVVIKTNYHKIKKAFTAEQVEDIYPTKVQYLDFNNDGINLQGNAMTTLTVKRKEYSDEKEVRFIVAYPKFVENKVNELNKDKSHEMANLLKAKFYNSTPIIKCAIDLNFIDEIKLSPYAPKWYLSVIQDLLIKYDCNWLKITQSEL